MSLSTPANVTKIRTPVPTNTKEDEEDHKCEDERDTTLYKLSESELCKSYEPKHLLGNGAYGVVYLGESLNQNRCGLKNGTRVAIKKVIRVFQSKTDARRLLREIQILRLLQKHENIVQLYDILPPIDPESFTTLVLIFESVESDLAKIFRTEQYFTRLHVKWIFYQIVMGMKFIHSGDIVHRDLKPSNILINEDCSVKICDFGLARGFNEEYYQSNTPTEVSESPVNNGKRDKRLSFTKKRSSKPKIQRIITKHVQTRWYRAPEVILLQQTKENLPAVDMWSLGCIFGELLQMMQCNKLYPLTDRKALFGDGKTCFPLSWKDDSDWASPNDLMPVMLNIIGAPSTEEIEKISDVKAREYLITLQKVRSPQHRFKELFPGAIDQEIDLLTGLLHFDVEKRYDVKQVLEHDYLKDVRMPQHETTLKDTISFAFEGKSLTTENLRALILNEALAYNKDRKKSWTESDAWKHYPQI